MFNFKLKIDWVLGKFGYVPKVEVQPLIPPTLKKPVVKKATTRPAKKVAAKKAAVKKAK